jgi:methylglutaconyl-CoA hydratase
MTVRFEDDGPIRRIVLARPEVRNALNDDVMRRIAEALDRIERDDRARVVIVTGEGKAFSAGADLEFMRRIAEAGPEANRADAIEMGGLFHRISELPKPVIARVNGPAIGGGVGLMAACDIVIASEEAFFQFSEVRLGLVPAVISPFCVRRMGAATARRLFLTGERFDARTAASCGLVDHVVASSDLDKIVSEVCEQLQLGGPEALAEAKKLIDAVSNLPPRDVLSYTAECIARLRAGAEAQEGMKAFLEKSPASWARGTRHAH